MKQNRNNQPYPIGLLGNYYDISNSQNEKMQNKPNLYIELLPPKAPQPNNQSSLINNQLKGEPNLNHRDTNYAKRSQFTNTYVPEGTKFYPKLFTNIYPPKAAFPKKTKKNQKKPKKSPKYAFCKFWILTHLTLCATKTYITIIPQNTLQERSLLSVFLAGKNAK